MLCLLPQITLKSQYTSDCLKYLNLRKLKTNRIAVIMRQLYEREKFSTSNEKVGKRTLLGKLILSFQVFFFSEKSLTDNLNTLVLPSLWQRQSVCWCLILGGSWGSGDRLQRPRPGRTLREGVKTSGARRSDCGMLERRHCLPLLTLNSFRPCLPSSPLSRPPGLVPEPPDQVEEEARSRDGHGQEEAGLGNRAAERGLRERGGGRRL